MKNLVERATVGAPDNLFAGNDLPVLTKGVTFAADSGVFLRGTVLAIGVNGKADKAGADSTADCVLADDIDTAKETVCEAYTSGLFNRDALICDGGITSKQVDELRLRGIYVKDPIN